jgi:hypothetical protein
MFRLQWSTQNIPKTHPVSKLSPNSSGDLRSLTELVVRRHSALLPNSSGDLRSLTELVVRRHSALLPNSTEKGLTFLVAPRPKPTTFFHNTSMLLRIDPRLNNTKCMSCGKGAL